MLFYDTEHEHVITREQLFNEYINSEHVTDCTFEQFIHLCLTAENGTLEEVKDDMYNELFAMVFKHGDDDYSICFPSIPDDEPLLIALLNKYGTEGYSVRGTLEDIRQELNG